MNYLKKQYPELYQFVDTYYNKGKDRKAHYKELLDNPSTFLLVYEDFLQNHDPLDDPEEETEPTK